MQLTAIESQVLEEALVNSLTEDQPVYMKHGTDGYRKLRYKVGKLLRIGGEVDFTDDELWTCIHCVSVFTMMGSEAAGLNLKCKFYEEVNS